MPDPLMPTTVRLAAAMDALAALAAHVRVESEGLPVSDEIRELLREIADEVLGGPCDTSGPVGGQVVGLTRAFLRQAVDLVEDPGREGDWAEMDETLLQGIGRLSGAVATAFRAAEDELPGLREALDEPGARFLDVGTGTGWLAIATAQTYPAAHITGIDVFETALDLARQNVAASGVADRIDLRIQDAAALDEVDRYDAVWFPLPFVPETVVEAAIAASIRALKPGGWLLAGTFTGPPDHLSELLTDLRIRRSGGRPWPTDELLLMLERHDLTAREVPRTWPAPVQLHSGQKPL